MVQPVVNGEIAFMDRLGAMEIFIRLSELGSFTAVAEEMNTSKSKISKEFGRLEEYIGARLLHRSTRHLRLTSLGEAYLQRCKNIIGEVNEAQSFIEILQQKPSGKLRISVPMALGLTQLSSAFADFMRVYPDIELQIHLSDESVDIIEQAFDIALRAASTTFDSNYIGKRLTQFSYRVVASQKYLALHPPIKSPEDLKNHNCFVYSYFRKKNFWPLGEGVSISGTLKVNSTIFMMDLVREGLGIGFIPDFVCNNAVEQGDIVSILPDYIRPQLTLYAMYSARHYMPTTLRYFIDFIEHWFRNKEMQAEST